MNLSKVETLISKIKEIDIYEDLSYYTFHLGLPLWRLFTHWNGIPFYLRKICEETDRILMQSEATIEEILLYLANSTKDMSYFYVCNTLLLTNTGIKLNEIDSMNILTSEKRLPQEVVIDRDKILVAIVGFTLDTNRFMNWDFRTICPRECFQYEITDYKLTKVSGVEFCPQGFIYDNKYYLYNIFINRNKLNNFDRMPAVFKVLSDNIRLNEADFYLRLDERLSIPLSEADVTDRVLAEKFRGIQFNLNNTRLDKIKNIIVHGDIETFDKLLMVIKKDYDTVLDEEFWHIELEELPYVENKVRDTVCVTFIHGKYYPNQKVFTHMDFIKNQYEYQHYCEKYNDLSNGDIKIDFYTTKECHYKIWCVENIDISEETWYKAANISLGPVFRKLYNEIMENTLCCNRQVLLNTFC
ncbi:hypothetical protein [Neobacillus drentensis]|uniref:hypothetical protein n=1 Tax=Neobacillus drentensis TaxID=220684 RepID=UPI00285669BD|nr:hypothetical protein [Neobacillus drentensis]MDR7239151.1 hypothetical protein [Neobacillus drentensis]